MNLRVAFQMDPIESINFDTDTSLILALEAQKRGHTLYHYLPRHLSLSGNKVLTRARPLQVRYEKGNHYTVGAEEIVDLGAFDIVLMRQDPPFDLAYITATHMLEHIQPRTCVFNDPAGVRNAPEKILVTHFPHLMPPTLISSDYREIENFRTEHKDLIVKPLYGHGGAGIFHVPPDSDNLGALIELYAGIYKEPVVIQKYMPEVREGDKRIVLIEGRPVGALLRIPAHNEVRTNMRVGGQAVHASLTKRDFDICEAIGPELRRRGLVLAGIDVIGGFITEVNVTSPTGLQVINRLENACLQSLAWDAFEARFQQSRSQLRKAI